MAEATALLAAIENAAGGLEELSVKLSEEGREPALEVLMDWAKAIGHPAKRSKAITKILKSKNMSAWRRAPKMLKPAIAKVGKNPDAIERVFDQVAALPGAFPAELAEQARVNADDAEALKAVIEDVDSLPALWLASEYFGW